MTLIYSFKWVIVNIYVSVHLQSERVLYYVCVAPDDASIEGETAVATKIQTNYLFTSSEGEPAVATNKQTLQTKKGMLTTLRKAENGRKFTFSC